jgi:hypothetical protein
MPVYSKPRKRTGHKTSKCPVFKDETHLVSCENDVRALPLYAHHPKTTMEK